MASIVSCSSFVICTMVPELSCAKCCFSSPTVSSYILTMSEVLISLLSPLLLCTLKSRLKPPLFFNQYLMMYSTKALIGRVSFPPVFWFVAVVATFVGVV